jgi:peptidoglycan/LPS O-acetylase OafA/YrhL
VSWGQTPGATLAVPLVWAACLLCEEPGLPRPAQRLLRPWSALLQAAPLQWLGGLSYPLYLIHAPVQRLLMLAVGPLAGGSWACFTLVWAPLAVLLPLAAAYPLHRRVELPCWRWSRAWATGAGTPLSSSSAHVMRGPTRLAARTASGRRDG